MAYFVNKSFEPEMKVKTFANSQVTLLTRAPVSPSVNGDGTIQAPTSQDDVEIK